MYPQLWCSCTNLFRYSSHLQACEAASLSDVAGSVEDSACDPVEVLRDGESVSILQCLWDYGPAQPDACEAGVLGK